MLSIGQFSKACHVTIKTLHHYDKLQLLKPAYIDPQSGFRYYKSSQIETMMQIQKYKRYGFSLEQIQHLLALQPMQRKSFFEQKKMELIHQKDELELVIQDLKVIISKLERTNMNENTILETNHVDLVEFPYTYIYSVRDTMGVGDFGRYFSKIFEELKEKMSPNSVSPDPATLMKLLIPCKTIRKFLSSWIKIQPIIPLKKVYALICCIKEAILLYPKAMPLS